MDGAHDLGGKPGFGRIDSSQDSHFPNQWEEKVFGLTLATGMLGRWNLDQTRSAREQMEGDDYLSSSYYEHWLFGLEYLLIETSLASADEIQSGQSASDEKYNFVSADRVPEILAAGGPVNMDCSAPAIFSVGANVTTINHSPTHHTRLPAYARNKTGTIIDHHGCHVFPDRHAVTGEKQAEHLYTIVFSGEELWGKNNCEAGTEVCLDIFESYITGTVS